MKDGAACASQVNLPSSKIQISSYFKAALHNNTASQDGEAMSNEATLSNEDVSQGKAVSQISLPQNKRCPNRLMELHYMQFPQK
jgi:hypothetical protein